MYNRKEYIPKRCSWDILYKKAKAFYDEHGRFPFRKEDHQVYIWARTWWQNGGPDKNPQRARMLQDVGFNIQNKQEKADNTWWNRYNQLKAFYDEHGHFPTLTENKSLHGWACYWCTRYGAQNPEKKRMLVGIGYVYQPLQQHNDRRWMINYQEAKFFFDEYGHFPSYKENRKIKKWARKWWIYSYLKNPEKHQHKADMLYSLGYIHKQTGKRLH